MECGNASGVRRARGAGGGGRARGSEAECEQGWGRPDELRAMREAKFDTKFTFRSDGPREK
jgi:hypothetical protein